MENNRLYESGEITNAYAKYRNIYPKQLADVIMEYAFETKPNQETKEKLGRLVEVGCGSGQITKLLAPYFDEVIASDVSPNQIKYAKESNTFEHVEYVVGAAEDIHVADQSADMVVSAESIHWFDLSKFFREVTRVMKPDGCLAILWYFLPQCSPPGGDVELSASSCAEVMNNVMSQAGYNIYKEAQTLLSGIFQKLPSEKKVMKFMSWTIPYTLTGCKDYLRSDDAFQKQNTAGLNRVIEFGCQLKRAWKMEERSDEEVEINATFKFTIVLARNIR